MTETGSRSVRIEDLPPSWFRRTQYRPRIRGSSGDTWFVLDRAFAPPRSIPVEPPVEPLGGRGVLRASFEGSYERWGLPIEAETRRSLAAVSEPGSAVVVAGQQPGFLGGPLMSLYKALSAVGTARAYRAMTGRACVPVFWVASEDHDLDEVRDARFPGKDPGGVTFRYPGVADRRPLSDYPMGPEALAVVEAAAEHLGARRHGATARSLLGLYRGRTLAGGFAAAMQALLGHTGLLVLDPAEVRPQAVSIFRRVIEHPAEVLACVERGRRDVQARGMEPIVAGRFPLFAVLDGKRQHLAVEMFGLRVDGGGPSFSREALVRMLGDDASAFSPGALLRPLVQQATLPCVLTVGGPAEVGYYAQLGPLADFLAVPRPAIALRLTATAVDGKPARFAMGIPLGQRAEAASPADLLPKVADPPGLAALRGAIPALDATALAAVAEVADAADASKLRTRAAEVRLGLEKLVDRVDKAHARRRTRETEAATRLWEMVFPGGELQERRWGHLHFVAKHGTAWIDELIADVARDPLRVAHRWITFLGSEDEEGGTEGHPSIRAGVEVE